MTGREGTRGIGRNKAIRSRGGSRPYAPKAAKIPADAPTSRTVTPKCTSRKTRTPTAPPTKYTIAHLPLPIRSSKVGEIRISPRRVRKICVSEACTNANVIHVHGAGAEPRPADRARSKATGEDRTNPNEEVATWSA